MRGAEVGRVGRGLDPMLADVLSQINGRKHATTQVAPNLAFCPKMALLSATLGAGPSTRCPPGNQGWEHGIRVTDKRIQQGQQNRLEQKGTQGSAVPPEKATEKAPGSHLPFDCASTVFNVSDSSPATHRQASSRRPRRSAPAVCAATWPPCWCR